MEFTAHLEEVNLDIGGTVMPLVRIVRKMGSRETAPRGKKG